MSARTLSIVVCIASLAAVPATHPTPPTIAPDRGDPPPLIDPRQPAFVPSFAKVDNPPAGRFVEREYAHRYDAPGPYFYGYRGYGRYGWAYGSYGFGGGYAGPAGSSR